MSLNKAIKSGKEHRKEYSGAQAIDRSCRCGGTCLWCRDNRTIKNQKRLNNMLDKLNELEYNESIEDEEKELI